MTCFSLTSQAKQDIQKLKKEDKKLPAKVLDLIIAIGENQHTPLNGIGKPEALRNNLKGCFSRRINDKHRIIYKYNNNQAVIISCYGHYADK